MRPHFDGEVVCGVDLDEFRHRADARPDDAASRPTQEDAQAALEDRLDVGGAAEEVIGAGHDLELDRRTDGPQASAKRTLWSNGTQVSASPCCRRNGGASART